MEVVPKVPWIDPLVGFSIVTYDDYPDICEVSNIWLKYKWIAEVAESCMVIYIFGALEKMDSHTSVFPVLLDHNFRDSFLLKTGRGFE